MNVTFKEWNALLTKAQSLCDELRSGASTSKPSRTPCTTGGKASPFWCATRTERSSRTIIPAPAQQAASEPT